MNKKLLTAAVAAALVSPMAANAGVTVYGQVQVEIASEGFDNKAGELNGGDKNEHVRPASWQGTYDNTTGAGDGGKLITVEDNQRGRFGIKADEDLGGGLTGLATIEYDLGHTTEFGSGPTIRQAFVGLKGGFGTVTLGSLKTAYKYTGGVKYDPFVTTNLEARRNGGMIGGVFGANGFLSNAIGYNSPKWGGMVQLSVQYSPDEGASQDTSSKTSTSAANANNGDDGDYTASIKVGQKNWEAFLAIAHDSNNEVAGRTTSAGAGVPFLDADDDYDAVKIGGKFSFGKMHTVVVQVEQASQEVGTAGEDESQIIFLGYHLKLGKTVLVLQGSQGVKEFGSAAITEDQEWTYLTVGAIHKFSKQTRLFGGISKTAVDNYTGAAAQDGDRQAISVGLRKDF